MRKEEQKPLEVEVTAILVDVGVPAHIKGYQYLRDGVILAVENPAILDGLVTKELYPAIAKKYKTTPSRVERAMRTAIEKIWNWSNLKALKKYFGHSINPNKRRKPTNSEFIAMIVDRLYLTHKYDSKDSD